MNAIMIGFEGVQDMIERIYGKPGSVTEKQPAFGTRARASAPARERRLTVEEALNQPLNQMPKLTSSAFDKMFSGQIGKPN